jgi:hypothetical protein
MGGGGEASIELTSFVQAFTALMAEAAMETAIESFIVGVSFMGNKRANEGFWERWRRKNSQSEDSQALIYTTRDSNRQVSSCNGVYARVLS